MKIQLPSLTLWLIDSAWDWLRSSMLVSLLLLVLNPAEVPVAQKSDVPALDRQSASTTFDQVREQHFDNQRIETHAQR